MDVEVHNTGSGRTALLLFTRTSETETKRFGLGGPADRRLALCLLERTLHSLAEVLAPGSPVAVVTDAPLSAESMAVIRASGARPLELRQQGTGFEERFLGALEQVAALGFERLVAIGSDTPELEPLDLRRALDCEPDEAVIGPSRDGGVYLLSLRREQLPLLRGLPWQRPGLFRALLSRVRVHGAACRLLPVRCDVDEASAVRSLRPLLERLCQRYLGVALSGRLACAKPLLRSRPPRLVPVLGLAPSRAPPRGPEAH